MKKNRAKCLLEVIQWGAIVAFMTGIVALEIGRKTLGPDEHIQREELQQRCDSLEVALMQAENENYMLRLRKEMELTWR